MTVSFVAAPRLIPRLPKFSLLTPPTPGPPRPNRDGPRPVANEPTRDPSVILLYLHGGPSHLETYDLKPNAPTPYRSIFKPIPTNVPGIDICELFPRQAKLADAVEHLGVSQQSRLNASNPLSDLLCGANVREASEPCPEFIGQPDFHHP